MGQPTAGMLVGAARVEDDRRHVVAVLRDNGTGVLSLNDWNGPAPHPVPVAYGYDADRDRFVVQPQGDTASYKKRCLQRDRNVAFTVTEEAAPGEAWCSVVLKGELAETSYGDAEPALAALASNTSGAPNPIRWGDADTVEPYELRIEEWSGRAFDIA